MCQKEYTCNGCDMSSWWDICEECLERIESEYRCERCDQWFDLDDGQSAEEITLCHECHADVMAIQATDNHHAFSGRI